LQPFALSALQEHVAGSCKQLVFATWLVALKFEQMLLCEWQLCCVRLLLMLMSLL